MARPHKQMPGMTYHIRLRAHICARIVSKILPLALRQQQMLQINSNREDSLRLCSVVCVEKLPT